LQSKNDYDVRDWGVKCDGTTDDSPALQAMFDSIRTTKGTGRVVFPVIPELLVTWSGNPAMCSLSSTVTVKGDQLTIWAWGTLFRCRMNAAWRSAERLARRDKR
jgi:hypothetical protein